MTTSFSFVDLFAGVGGFHAALAGLGGECWFVSEIDRAAAAVYEANWLPAADRAERRLQRVDGDIVPLTQTQMLVPPTDVLAAGFPCQPFSKSGAQHGMNETRGTLFWNICRVLEEHKPAVVLLENVRNLAGPRHRHEWDVIVDSLRDLGYRVSSTPAVFSPHLLPPELGGRPQVRERVFITATYVGRTRARRETDVEPVVLPRPVGEWDPQTWDLATHLPLQADDEVEGGVDQYRLSKAEYYWVQVWEDLISHLVDQLDGERLPGFPIWADEFRPLSELHVPAGTPTWKAEFLR
ncbi:MAG: DNA (cytosine-5-)-methyltransferase, partial [Janthinobacterium lividum]